MCLLRYIIKGTYMLMKVNLETLNKIIECEDYTKPDKHAPMTSFNKCRQGCTHCDICDTKRVDSIKHQKY